MTSTDAASPAPAPTPAPVAAAPVQASPESGEGPAAEVGEEFASTFGGVPDGVWWAPGRMNLIGEHTDYNDGFVLPLAIAFGTAAAVRVRRDGVLRVHSVREDATVEIALDEVGPGSPDGWAGYVAGVGWALRRAGHDVPGLDVVVDGDVPSGGGLSSSAALECAVAVAWNDLAGLGLGLNDLAAAARSAENDVVGVSTGVMDQMASLHGRAGHVMFIDTRSLDVEHVPLDLARYGLGLLVIDTRTPHALVDGEYAERHTSCARAAELLGVPALRDITLDGLDDALARLPDDLLRRRVRHIVTENARVLDVVATLRSGADPRAIGPALTASHASMRDDFEITVPQVDTAVQAALDAGAHGARMTGGGFGGSVLALIDMTAAGEVGGAVKSAYARAGFGAPEFFVALAGDGARRLS